MALLSTKTGLPSFSAQDNAIVNYFTDGGFERGSNGVIPTGWSQYNDGAVAVPVDGTGGAAVAQVTMLVTNSSPIRGTLSAVISKDANNRQGVGYSFPFTISNADKGITAGVNFELVTSANYVAGDMVFYIYDVTNSTLITPRSVSLPALPSYGKFFSDYGLTAGTSYRFILHIATTSALAYTVTLDTMVNTTTRAAVPGPVLSNWISFTPTISWSGAIGTPTARYAISGPNIHISFCVNLTGAPTESGSEFTLTLPNSWTVDTTALTASGGRNGFGSGTFYDSAAGYLTGHCEIADYGTTNSKIRFMVIKTSAAATHVFGSTSQTNNFPKAGLVSGDVLTFNCMVPISQLAGSGSNFGPGASLEYAYNSSTSITNDLTSFGYGPGGVLIKNFAPSGTGAVTKRVRLQNAIQNDDVITVEVWDAVTGNVFINITQRLSALSSNDAGTTYYGCTCNAVNSTDVDVNFYSAPYPGLTWAAINTWFWRVKRAKATAPVGQVLASTDGREGLYKAGQAPGLISGATIASGYIGEYYNDSSPTFWTTSNANIISRTLQPGAWRITAKTSFNSGAGPTGARISISTTSVTHDSTNDQWIAENTTTGLASGTAETIVNISVATTYYLVGNSTGGTVSSVQRTNLICQRIG